MERKLKDSGIPWIGSIPEHWEVEKGKNIFSLRTSKGNDTLEHLAATQTHGMYPQRLLDGVVQVAANTDYTQFRTVHINDFVISLRSFQGGFEISNYEGVCSPAYQVFYNKVPICHNYFRILFKSVSFIEFMNSLTVGIREGKNIQYTDFSLSFLPVPPVGEQEAIAGYLDEKCGEIDELIEVEQQMITDLEAYRQAVITEAVTRGLNPLAPLRPSGIDWIPQIPEHWQLATIGKLYDVVLGKMLSPKPSSDLDTSESYFCAKDVHFCGINKSNLKEMYFSPFEKEKYRVNDGDLLIVEGGSAGECAIASIEEGENIFIQNSLLIARSKENSVRFLKYFIENLVRAGYISVTCNVATFVHYTKEKVCNTPFFVPPLAEQQAIADYLDAKCGEIAELIKVKQDKIETLKQYRQSLIFEAVTGKINIS